MRQSIADAYDSYFKWLVLFLLLTSVKHAMEATAYLVDQDMSAALHAWAHWPARAGIAAVLIGLGTVGSPGTELEFAL